MSLLLGVCFYGLAAYAIGFLTGCEFTSYNKHKNGDET